MCRTLSTHDVLKAYTIAHTLCEETLMSRTRYSRFHGGKSAGVQYEETGVLTVLFGLSWTLTNSDHMTAPARKRPYVVSAPSCDGHESVRD